MATAGATGAPSAPEMEFPAFRLEMSMCVCEDTTPVHFVTAVGNPEAAGAPGKTVSV